MKLRQNRHGGFTLIELMIVVAVVAILSAIAFPSYQSFVLKGRRAEARTALLELMQQQERFMTQRGTYQDFSTTAAGVTTPASAATTFKTFTGDNGTAPAYRLSADACPNPSGGLFGVRDCIRGIATPTRADPLVDALTMTTTGVKDCTGTTTDKKLCWP